MTVVSRPADPLAWLPAAAEARERAGLHRSLRSRPPVEPGLLDLAGNDYLALSRHPEVVDAAVRAVRAYGAGATGSRAVTGTTDLHIELEDALAAHLGADEALVLSSGYLANLAAVTALSGPGTLVVSDAANHASLVDACRLSRARVVVVASGDVVAAEQALACRSEERALLVTDAVFSSTGARADLRALHAAARRTGALLVVDEAHSLGVVGPDGRGAVHADGLAGAPDVVVTATLSKALGSQGGAVLGRGGVRGHLIDTARPFLFDTGLAPPAVGAALAALRLVDRDRVAALHAAATALCRALELPLTESAVIAVVLGDPGRASAARDACLREGLVVGCFRPPSVAVAASCLRLTARADLAARDVERAAGIVRTVLRDLR